MDLEVQSYSGWHVVRWIRLDPSRRPLRQGMDWERSWCALSWCRIHLYWDLTSSLVLVNHILPGCNHVSKCWMGRHGVPSFRWDWGPSVVMNNFVQDFELWIFSASACIAMRTKDSFIADLVVGQIFLIFIHFMHPSWYDLVWINFASPKGLRTGQIKTGAPCRSERLAKCLEKF